MQSEPEEPVTDRSLEPRTAAPSTDRPARARSAAPLLGAVALATLVADQATKAWALAALDPGQPIDVLGRFLRLQLIANSGAAFSLASGQTWLLTLIAVVVGGFIAWHARTIVNRTWAVGLGLVLGGLLGNLYDRLFRPPAFAQGHVVDFLNYNGWFIGNVADIAIVGAAALLVLLSWRGISYDSETGRTGVERPARPAEGTSR
nr:signal peptidase II [Arsenicicoccus piscis]